ncbi:hypothetical protein [Streptomyces wuyuanensis]
MVQKGVSLYEVQHLLGHESFQTTQRITPAAGRPRGGPRSLGASGRAADHCRMNVLCPVHQDRAKVFVETSVRGAGRSARPSLAGSRMTEHWTPGWVRWLGDRGVDKPFRRDNGLGGPGARQRHRTGVLRCAVE